MCKRFLSVVIAILVFILTMSAILAEGDEPSVLYWNADTTAITVGFSCAIDQTSLNGKVVLTEDSIPVDDEDYSLKISADGKTLSITPVGGISYASSYMFTILIGIKSVDGVEMKIPFQKAFKIAEIFYDDFETSTSGDYRSNPSNFTIEGGKLNFSGEVGRFSAQTSVFPVNQYVADYTTQTDIVFGHTASFIMYVRASNNYRNYNEWYKYNVLITGAGTVALDRYSTASSYVGTRLFTTNIGALDLSKTYRLRVMVKGNNIKAYLDDIKIIDYYDTHDDALISSGTFGIHSYSGAGRTIDNIRLTKVEETPYFKPQINNLSPVITDFNKGEISLSYDFEAQGDDQSMYTIYTSDDFESGYSSVLTRSVETSGHITAVINDSYIDKYIKVAILPIDSNGHINDLVYTETVKGPFRPKITNFEMEGEIVLGGALRANYVFYDENGDDEGESLYQWYASDLSDGVFKPIKGANTLELEIDSVLVDRFLRLHITPVSVNYPQIGYEYISEYYCRLFEPIAKNIIITGEATIGAILEGSYEYFDHNKQPETDSTYRWLKSSDKNGKYTLIEGQTTKFYTITNDDIDKYIKFEVTPKKEEAIGAPTLSEPFVCPSRPIAKNVGINGTAKVNSVIVGKYDYHHPNGIQEGASEYRWYVGGSIVGTGISYTVKSADSGKSIVFEVVPKAVIEPYVGDAVKSRAVNIASSATYSGGGGGGGAGYSIVSSIVQDIIESSDSKDAKNKTAFTDIENSPHKETIIKMFEKGIIKGVSENLFEPDRDVTRAEFATLMVRALDLESTVYNEIFNDVNNDDWYAGNIQVAANNNLINGYDGMFRPNDSIKKEEMLKVVVQAYVNAKGDVKEKTDLSTIDDSNEISNWAITYVSVAVDLGLVEEKGSIYPQKNALRGEVATILSKLLDRIGG